MHNYDYKRYCQAITDVYGGQATGQGAPACANALPCNYLIRGAVNINKE